MAAGSEAGAVLEASGEVSDREELLNGRMQVVLDGEAAGRPLSCALSWSLGRAGEVPVEEADLTFETDEGELNALLSADLGGGVVRVDPDTGEAVADLRHLYAATARRRDMVKPVLSPKAAAAKLRAFLGKAEASGVRFGPERTGLDNDDITLADAVLEVPLNPAYASLNLAQAVLIVAYEFYQARDVAPEVSQGRNGAIAATKDELLAFFEHLEDELDAGGFLIPPEKRPHMVRNIRNIFQRAGLTEQEVRTLRGMITSLASRRGRKGG